VFLCSPLSNVCVCVCVCPPLFQVQLQEVDITLPENRVWFDRYRYHIPVFHLNGQFLMMHRVNSTLLEKRLDEATATGQ